MGPGAPFWPWKTRFDLCGSCEPQLTSYFDVNLSTGQNNIMQKKRDESAAAAAAAAAAGVVVARAFGRLQLGVDGLLIEALVVEFALLGVAQDI